jgi:hypothetical protein
VAGVSDFLKNPFAFLFARNSAEDRVAEYVKREHAGGRSLAEVLEDHYVQNRLSPEQQRRLLDRPDLIHAVGVQDIAAARDAV